VISWPVELDDEETGGDGAGANDDTRATRRRSPSTVVHRPSPNVR
jgi:hypothetical protein